MASRLFPRRDCSPELPPSASPSRSFRQLYLAKLREEQAPLRRAYSKSSSRQRRACCFQFLEWQDERLCRLRFQFQLPPGAFQKQPRHLA
jgi:hypothetical protein